jgi:hypothetical protein
MRQYDALTGRLLNVTSSLHDARYESVLTACCFGSRFRKFFVGDAGGLAREYNTDLGEIIQDIPFRHKEFNKQVRFIQAIPEESLLILAFADTKILFYDMSDP